MPVPAEDRTPHAATACERTQTQRYRWFRAPAWDYVASGRLVLTLPSTGRTNRYRWADTKRSSVDQKLAGLFAELEARAITDQQRQDEAERTAAAQRVEWEEVRQRAIARLEEDHRARWLDEQMDLWRKAKEISDYVGEVRAGRTLTEAEESWLEWAGNYADHLLVAGVHDHHAPSGLVPHEATGHGACPMQPPGRPTQSRAAPMISPEKRSATRSSRTRAVPCV